MIPLFNWEIGIHFGSCVECVLDEFQPTLSKGIGGYKRGFLCIKFIYDRNNWFKVHDPK